MRWLSGRGVFSALLAVGASLRWSVGGEGPAGLCWLCGLVVGESKGTEGGFMLLLQKKKALWL